MQNYDKRASLSLKILSVLEQTWQPMQSTISSVAPMITNIHIVNKLISTLCTRQNKSSMQARPLKLCTKLWRFVLSDLRERGAVAFNGTLMTCDYLMGIFYLSVVTTLLLGHSFGDLSSGWWGSSRAEGGKVTFDTNQQLLKKRWVKKKPSEEKTRHITR